MTCADCPAQLTTMAARSAGRCSSCDAKRRDSARLREREIEAARDRVVEAARDYAGSDDPVEDGLAESLIRAVAALDQLEGAS